MMRAWFNILCCLLLSVIAFGQHKTAYSQFMFNGMLLNPGYAGSHEALNITALYRNQWTGFPGAPKAISLSAHSPVKNRKLAAAFLLENESAGLFSHSQAKGVFAYRLRIDDIFLSFGMQAGADVRSFDREALRIRHGDDPVFLQSMMRTTAFAGGAGVYLHGNNFYCGFAAPEITGARGSGPGLLQFHSGGLLHLSQEVVVKPSVLLRSVENSPLLFSAAVTGYYKEIAGLGTGYTAGAAWFVYLDLRINEQLGFGYAYERATSALAAYNTGSHEIMIRYLFRYRIAAQNPRYF